MERWVILAQWDGEGSEIDQLQALVAFVEDLGSVLGAHCDLQLSITPVPGDPMPFSDVWEHQAHIYSAPIYTEAENTHVNK